MSYIQMTRHIDKLHKEVASLRTEREFLRRTLHEETIEKEFLLDRVMRHEAEYAPIPTRRCKP